MPLFPTLKTGAVAQYPLDLTVRFQTESVRFLDGSQQRYRIRGNGLRKWSIQLNMLDGEELTLLVEFAELQGSTPFAFTDPATGETAIKCVIAEDRFEAIALDETIARTNIVIQEIV
jgi:hypothetical protein